MIDLHEGVAELFRDAQELTIRRIERAHWRAYVKESNRKREWRQFNRSRVLRQNKQRVDRMLDRQREKRAAVNVQCPSCRRPVVQGRFGRIRRFCSAECRNVFDYQSRVERIQRALR